jgi:hypothetical protein
MQTLLPKGVTGDKGGLLNYEIVIYTSDVRGAGTDADIFVEIWGDKVGRVCDGGGRGRCRLERNARSMWLRADLLLSHGVSASPHATPCVPGPHPSSQAG